MQLEEVCNNNSGCYQRRIAKRPPRLRVESEKDLKIMEQNKPPTPIEQIRQLRAIAGLSQFGLAQVCGVERTRLSLFENGYVELQPHEYTAVENALLAVIRRRATELQGTLQRHQHSYGE
jgi:DNA-binding XRE family transcriptional regulator